MKTWQIFTLVVAPLGAAVILHQCSQDEEMAKLRKEFGVIRVESAEAAAAAAAGERREWAAHAVPPIVQPSAPSPEPKLSSATPPPSEVAAKEPVRARSRNGAELSDHYAAAFTAEAEDAEWATSARHIATDRVRSDLPSGSELRSIDCRKSMCRIETSHTDRRTFQEFVRKAFSDPATGVWNGGSFSGIVSDNSEPSGTVIVVSYLAREGSELPPPDPSELP
jgi:hypothetical protein